MLRNRKRLLLPLIPVVFLALLLGGAELFLRLRHQAFQAEHDYILGTFRAATLDGLVYERIPHTGETNNLGFRGRDFDPEKAPGVFRIVVLGDSVAQGHGVAVNETFGHQLEALFAAEPLAPPVEVLVVAETGYNTAQELLLLEHAAAPLHPDLLIWAYCLNDPAHALYHNESNLYSRYFHEPRSHVLYALHKALFKIRENLLTQSENREYHRLLHTVYAPQVQEHVARLAALGRELRVPVLLFIVPVLETRKLEQEPGYVISAEAYGLQDLHAELTRLARENGLEVVDGLEAFSGHPLSEVVLGGHDIWHPNAPGHALLAGQLRRELRARHLPR